MTDKEEPKRCLNCGKETGIYVFCNAKCFQENKKKFDEPKPIHVNLSNEVMIDLLKKQLDRMEGRINALEERLVSHSNSDLRHWTIKDKGKWKPK